MLRKVKEKQEEISKYQGITDELQTKTITKLEKQNKNQWKEKTELIEERLQSFWQIIKYIFQEKAKETENMKKRIKNLEEKTNFEPQKTSEKPEIIIKNKL